jgi:hypothetical protein
MNIQIGNTQHRGVDPPNICPHCHVVNEPKIQYQTVSKDTDNSDCNIQIWSCANQKCRKIFAVMYKFDGKKVNLVRYLNGLPKGPDWPKPILELKSGKLNSDGVAIQSNFIKTYLQSLEAEKFGLDELAGMGYRKAIEYLVKDWAIQNNPDEKEKIEKS